MSTLPSFDEFYRNHPERFGETDSSPSQANPAQVRALEAGLVEVPVMSDGGPPHIIDHTGSQTGLRDQDGRETCYAFAAVAGMEAVYRRQYGVTLDLSEQYAFHLNKVTEIVSNYLTAVRAENNSSNWGFQGSSDIVERLLRASIPDETACPYLDDAAMQQVRLSIPAVGQLVEASATQEDLDLFEFSDSVIPLVSRYEAHYQVKSYSVLPWTPSTDAVEAVLAAGHDVIADIPGHCLLIVGYDRNARLFTVKDSANPSSFQTMSYDPPGPQILAGRYITSVHPPDAQPQRDAMWFGRWLMEHDGWRGELVIRRTTNFHLPAPGQPTKLGNYYANGQRYDVNGEVTDAGTVLHFWIAGTTAKVAPGTLEGQEFRLYLFDHDAMNAAGVCWWEGAPFGVALTRWGWPSSSDADFTPRLWQGRWAMSHDGWSGTLEVGSTQPVRGRYTAESGLTYQAQGTSNGHALDLTVFGYQRFQLFLHTHNPNLASGTTEQDGKTYGVQLHRVLPVVRDPSAALPGAVPAVVGLSNQDAYDQLRTAGYTVESHWEWTSTQPEDYVSEQRPSGNAPDLPPSTVHIWVRTLPPEPDEHKEPEIETFYPEQTFET